MKHENVIIILRKSPYGHLSQIEGSRLAVGMTFSDIAPKVILCDDAVLGATKEQDSEGIYISPFSKVFNILKKNQVPILLVKEHLKKRGFSELDLDESLSVKRISLTELSELISEADGVLTL